MGFFKIICWAIIFITRLRFPPGISIAEILTKRDISTQTSIVSLSVPNEENNSNILSTELFDSEEEIDCTNRAPRILGKTGSDVRVQTKVREQSNRNI